MNPVTQSASAVGRYSKMNDNSLQQRDNGLKSIELSERGDADERAHLSRTEEGGRTTPPVPEFHGTARTRQVALHQRPEGLAAYMNKGDLSNLFTFCIMLLALICRAAAGATTFLDYLLAFGLFGFAGGITNWLAIKMLFDVVHIGPFMLVGSGVIPRQFKAIRLTVKNTIMKTFFDEEYMGRYLRDRSKSLLSSVDLSSKLESLLNKPDMDVTLAAKFAEMATKPEGMMLNSIAQMFGGTAQLVPVVKPMLISFGREMATMLTDKFDPLEYVSVERVRQEIDSLMEEKLQMLTPEIVKQLMEEVIRSHLGWLIVWGNIFGGFIGILSKAVGYG